MHDLPSRGKPAIVTRSLAVWIALLVATSAADAVADPAAPESPGARHVDVELDPTAFVLSGYSLHLGVGRGRLRVELGTFAIALPQLVHGDDGFDVSFHGFGTKLQYFPFVAGRGLFVGLDLTRLDVVAERQGSDLARRQTALGVGVHVGYRILLPAHCFVSPWLGVARAFGVDAVTLDGATYAQDRVSIYPAIHVGYQFQ